MSGKADNFYYAEFRLNSINLEVPGKYEISFSVLLYCSAFACRYSDDKIEVILFDQNGSRIAYYSLSDYDSILWRSNSLTFETTVSFVDVN